MLCVNNLFQMFNKQETAEFQEEDRTNEENWYRMVDAVSNQANQCL